MNAFLWMRIFILRKRALSFFGMPGLLSGGFSFGQESAALSSSVSSQR